MSLDQYINEQLNLLAPIVGISFGDMSDKSTWRIDFDKSASQSQIDAVNLFIENLVLDETTEEIARKYFRDKIVNSDLIYKKLYCDYRDANQNATITQFMDYLEALTI